MEMGKLLAILIVVIALVGGGLGFVYWLGLQVEQRQIAESGSVEADATAITADIEAEMESYTGATGAATTLHDTAFSTIPGAPAYVSKSPKYKASKPELGIDVDLQGHNAVQGRFLFEG